MYLTQSNNNKNSEKSTWNTTVVNTQNEKFLKVDEEIRYLTSREKVSLYTTLYITHYSKIWIFFQNLNFRLSWIFAPKLKENKKIK